MHTYGGLRATEAEVFDRTRLAIDLDDATDPYAPMAVFLMIGIPRPPPDWMRDQALEIAVERLGTRIGDLAGNRHSIYRMRATEICAIVEGDVTGLCDELWELNSELERERNLPMGIVIALVVMPEEATDTEAVLMLADRRLATSTQRARPGAFSSDAWARLSSVPVGLVS